MKRTRRKEEASSIAWGWVIETLADLKQVDTPLIDDLLSKIPHGSDSLPSSARERLALRRLDELLSSTTVADSRIHSPASDGIVIDVSESAEDVYSRLVSMMQSSSSRVSTSDSFKLCVHKFTLQKRACLPKCVIQQLEEVLTEGGHPHISVLRGTSGEVVQKLDQFGNFIIAQTSELNSIRSVPENQDKRLQEDIYAKPPSTTRKKVHFAYGSPTTHYTDDVVNDIEQRMEVGEVHQTTETSTSAVAEKQTEDLRDGQANNVGASHKRTRRQVTEEQDTQDSGRMEPKNVCESPKSPDKNMLSYDQNEAKNSAKGKLVQDLRENINYVDEDVGDCERAAKRMTVNTNGRDHHKAVFNCSVNDTHQEAVQDGLCGNNSQTDLEASGVELTVSQDSTGTDSAEEKACLKCNVGGQLLICSASTCFITVHESCLGSPASFDDAGNFYCPYCSYSRARIALQELTKKLTEAKKNAHLANNRLVEYMQNKAST